MLHREQQSDSPAVLQLKHMELSPQNLQLTRPTPILLTISQNNSSTLSECSEGTSRKFIFLLQETDQQTPPLTEGQQYLFTSPMTQEGTYHLQCLNYTKIKCKITLVFKSAQKEETNEVTSQPRITISPLERPNLEEVEQEKEQQTKQQPLEGNLSNSHSRSDYAQYQKILDEDLHYDYVPNKYLKYFKEQFKLWRDFFEYEPEKPPKQKYGSQGRHQDSLSSSSLYFSSKESQKQQSVISHLRSHQQISDIHQEELTHPKTMKKTNSEYGFNVQRQVQKTHMSSNSKRRPFITNTSSPIQKTEQSQGETFLDWACNWATSQGYQEVVLKKKGDKHLMNQWFTYLHNKFKVTEFMFG